MNTDTAAGEIPQAQPVIPTPDLTPYPGQPDVQVHAWLLRKAAPKELDAFTGRQYARALHNNEIDPAPKRGSDNYSHHYGEWFNRLTPMQRHIVEIARKHRDNDPKIIEQREANEKARLDKKRADPAYQQELADLRRRYARRVEIEEGREVRSYQKNRKLTKEEKQADQKVRTERVNARIRHELAHGRNPFSTERYDECYHATSKAGWKKVVGTVAKKVVCDKLIAEATLDLNSDDLALAILDACGKITWLTGNVELDEARDLIVRAVNTLRAASAIRKSGDKVYLHREIEREIELSEAQKAPGFGIM